MDELFWQVQSLINETRAGLCTKASDKVGYVQVQEFSWTPQKSRKMAKPDKKQRAQLVCTLGPLWEILA